MKAISGGAAIDRHGEWSQCERCSYPAQITRAATYGGFLRWDGSIVLCWDGRECLLRYKRKQRASPTPPHGEHDPR